jgi:hypothetical protein
MTRRIKPNFFASSENVVVLFQPLAAPVSRSQLINALPSQPRESRSGEASINHMPIRPIIAREEDAQLERGCGGEETRLGLGFGRLKASGDGLRARSQYPVQPRVGGGSYGPPLTTSWAYLSACASASHVSIR